MSNKPSLNLPGERLAFVGIGGGSDCIQAAILALLSGKPSCVLSIRANKTSSQGASGKTGEERTVNNHGGEVTKGVYRIKHDTTGSGRFLESIPAGKLPVYLVVDYKDGKLDQQIAAALKDFGAVNTVIGVDTGGDCLYRAANTVTDATKATPDQDLESLKAISLLTEFNLRSCVIAKGIDSPDYADDVLQQASAQAVNFSDAEKAIILSLYKEFAFDGSNPDRYGKTAFAWQAALRGETGPVNLPLPDRVVNDPKNPWNRCVVITPGMAGCHVMEVKRHLGAIESPAAPDFSPE